MTALAIPNQSLDAAQASLADLVAAIGAMPNVEDVNEARARISAARAWAKAHGRVKELRLDLLRVEVAALVRVVELGGANLLPASDRKAARFLAAMTPDERERFITTSRSATTAVGMCASVWRDDELDRLRRTRREAGQSRASDPTPPPDDEAGIEAARSRVHEVSAVLGELVESYTDAGAPFTIAEFADELVNSACVGDAAEDESLMQGVREVCRSAVLRAPIVRLGDSVLPRFVTARTEDGHFLRIPVEHALMAHLDDMRALRQEQLRQDAAALDRLDAVAAKLRRQPGCHDRSRIGDLVAASLARLAPIP